MLELGGLAAGLLRGRLACFAVGLPGRSVRACMSSFVISRRSLGGSPPREEIICKAEDGTVVKNVVRPAPTVGGRKRDYAAVNGLWLPRGIPGPGAVGAVPRRIWQTHKSQAYVDSVAELRGGQASWKALDGYQYRFCDDADRDALVEGHFPELYALYRNLPMQVMKADVWRYVVVYVHGGIYADMDTGCVREPRELVDTPSWLVTAPEDCPTPYFCQWVFAAAPRSPVMLAVVNEMTGRLRAEGKIDGGSFARDPHLVHRLTGPAMFTDAVRKFWASRGLPSLGRTEVYGRYPRHLMRVLPRSFHKRAVRHASLGASSATGWQAERDRLAVAGGAAHPRPWVSRGSS